MNEKIADEFVGDWRKDIHAECQIVFNLDQNSSRCILKCPNYAHSFCERFQMMKADFEAVPIDDLLGDPGNRNARTRGRHQDHIAVRAELQITDGAIMR